MMQKKTMLLGLGLLFALGWGVWLHSGTAPDVVAESSPPPRPAAATTPSQAANRTDPPPAMSPSSPPPDGPASTAVGSDTRRNDSTPTATQPRARVEMTSQGVRIDAHQATVAMLLHKLAAQTGLTISDRAHTQTTLVDLQLDGVAVDTAIKQLLAAFDVMLFYRGTPDGPSTLTAVWIYPPGHGTSPPAGKEEPRAVLETLHHPDAITRAQAYEEIVQYPEWLSPAMLHAGLDDAAAEVRLRLLTQALLSNVILPADRIASLALTDPEAEVRLAALTAVLFHTSLDAQQAEQLALEASHDPEPMVQSKAMEILQHLRASTTGELAAAFETLENQTNTAAPEHLGVPTHPE